MGEVFSIQPGKVYFALYLGMEYNEVCHEESWYWRMIESPENWGPCLDPTKGFM